MKPFGLTATLWATSIATLLSWRANRKKSLTPSGSLAAFGVGFASVWTGVRGFNLLVFYQLGTTATKYQKDRKTQLDGSIAASGSQARGPMQVLACSLLAVALGLFHAVQYGEERRIDFRKETDYVASCLTCGILAHHATCLADTLASEMGILAKSKPVLITQPWRRVPSGTNGGVSAVGTLWSAMGGFLMGVSTIALDAISGTAPSHAGSVLMFSTACGVVGSVVDSLLGATVQQTYWDDDKKLVYQADDPKPATAKLVTGMNLLNNEQVNIVSVAVTTGLGGWVLGPLIFGK